MPPRPFALIQGQDLWRRVAHLGTDFDPRDQSVTLAWDPAPLGEPSVPSGDLECMANVGRLAFDPRCRLYRTEPRAGRMLCFRWSERGTAKNDHPRVVLAAGGVAAAGGDLDEPKSAGHRFRDLDGNRTDKEVETGLRPGPVVSDSRGRLFLGDLASGRILILDPEASAGAPALLRAVTLSADAGPAGARRQLMDLQVEMGIRELGARGSSNRRSGARVAGPRDTGSRRAANERVVALQARAPYLLCLDAHRGPFPLFADESWPAGLPRPTADHNRPSRMAMAADGHRALLLDGGTAAARVMILDSSWQLRHELHAVGTRELIFDGEGNLVLARGAGQHLRRLRLRHLRFAQVGVDELPPLAARRYDGSGLALSPRGQVVFWSRVGPRTALPARRRFHRQGRVVSFRLDAGEFQNRWGRLLLDACIPARTRVRFRAWATDEPTEGPELPRTPPNNSSGLVVPYPEQSPPMPALSLGLQQDSAEHELARRVQGSELPWCESGPSAGNGTWETYEAPLGTEPGRYLWLVMELHGDGRRSPRLRSVRVEQEDHGLMRRLPRTYSRHTQGAEFLQRYLASVDSDLADLEARSAHRHILLDPRSAPPEMLPWLGQFLGLSMDRRWSTAIQRQLIAEAVWLFRFRGTVPGLTRLLQIVLGRAPVVVEQFRVRGLGGALLGSESPRAEAPGAFSSSAVLGAGFRVGGAVGRTDEVLVGSEGTPLDDGQVADAFATHAHRFTVVVPASLGDDKREVLQELLDLHRPAHTLVRICTVDSGLRLGLGMHLGLSSVIGRDAEFGSLTLGQSALGRGAILGQPRPGDRVGGGGIGRSGIGRGDLGGADSGSFASIDNSGWRIA